MLIAPVKVYGCHSGRRPSPYDAYLGQQGWEDRTDRAGVVHRTAVYRPIYHVMTTTCQYDKGATDPRCRACPHIKK